jgi:hypothetical protein
VSSLSVSGSVDVERGATLILGCSFDSPCRDDKLGTLLSRARIGRDLTAVQPLSVIVHSAVIGGSVRETGGGGGLACRYSGAYFSLGL